MTFKVYCLLKQMIEVISNLISKLGFMSNKMIPYTATNLLDPPSQVRGMTKWQPELFEKSVVLPHVDLPTNSIGWSNRAGNVFAILKDFKLKIPNFKSVVDVSDNDAIKRVILDPKMYEKMSEKDKQDIRESYDGTFGEGEHVLNYSNYTPSEALKHILPEDVEGLSSSQIVGHISYVQVRDHLLPYKEVIGQIMLNFSPRTKLVVTKTNTIDNKFRNLDLEILAGDPSLGFDVTVKENACSFKLDFSKVYWNPRLSTEHERIVDLVKRGDIVFDVFAGVGPFAVPLGCGSILHKHFRWQFWCAILGSVVCAAVGILWDQLRGSFRRESTAEEGGHTDLDGPKVSKKSLLRQNGL